MKKRIRIPIVLALIVVVLIGLCALFIALVGSFSPPAINTANSSCLRQLGFLLVQYQKEHGRLPDSMYGLPEYSQDPKYYQFRVSYDVPKRGADWIIATRVWPEDSDAQRIIAAAPFPSEWHTGQMMRLVLRGSGATDWIPEDEFLSQIAVQAWNEFSSTGK
ncbi:hypothetical protein [Ruficoccus sp. ZRK36]|uniref:hypothetical protein n=1 Tax=Ruficoccus sp. ZRK36 TaxID=2866311 RepID=UPI001C731474|nr:hypothetical protein [Ruficoccus sp. ZRK36]QYY36821.1 hypothetical protein K0V07_04925 [Ruficoccus sp. ZRK36]